MTPEKSFTDVFAQEFVYRTTITGIPVEADLFVEGSGDERTLVVSEYWCEDEIDLLDEDIKNTIIRNYELEQEMSEQIFDIREEGANHVFGIQST